MLEHNLCLTGIMLGSRPREEFGVCLSFEKTAQGLGLPKEWKWGDGTPLEHSFIAQTSCLFILEYLSKTLCNEIPNQPDPPPPLQSHRLLLRCRSWVPPILAPGGSWHTKRMEHLRLAVASYLDPDVLIGDGIRMLEHWDGLREGSKMNFLATPPKGLRPNADMDEEQQVVAGNFVNELVELGITGLAPIDHPTLLNAPLFVVAKEGQLGEWRVIADMLRGGQNDCMGNDPVFLPRTAHILDQMYTGGYSAMVDAPKFFYQFTTHPDDLSCRVIWFGFQGVPMEAFGELLVDGVLGDWQI
jgi:hypothetical protein